MNTLGTVGLAFGGYVVLMLFVIGLMRAAGLRRPRRDDAPAGRPAWLGAGDEIRPTPPRRGAR